MEPRKAAPEDIAQEQKKYTSSEVDTRTSKVDDRLHSREKEGFLAWRSRKTLSKENPAVQADWHHEPLAEVTSSRIPVLSTAAFVLSLTLLGFAAYFAWQTLNKVPVQPTATAKIDVEAKKTLNSGDILEAQVVVSNELAIPLELAELVITYPPGTFSPEDPTKQLTEDRQPLGTIAARSVRRGLIKARVFGTQGEEHKVHFALEYRAQGQSNIYQTEVDHAYTISTSSFTLTTEGLKEVVRGQTNDIAVSITSQAKTSVYDTVVTIAYPFGFTAAEVTPEEVGKKDANQNTTADTQTTAAGGNVHTWLLGDFAPGETKKIYLRGTYIGEDGDTKVFKISTGTRAAKDKAIIDTVLATGEHITTVKRPFLTTDLFLNGESPSTFVFTPGDPVRATLRWKNTLDVPLTNVSLGVVVGGDALRKTGIRVVGGLYRSVDSQIVWDASTKKDGTLQTVAPGASGTVEFTIQTLEDTQLAAFTNPAVTFNMRVAGKRGGESGVPETLLSTTTAEVPVRTKATFAAEATYFTSPFPQSGPLPPQVDTETVYAVQWRVASTSNTVEEGVVTAVLPPNVRFRNVRTPLSENITYDALTHTVTWYVGTLRRTDAVGGAPGRSVTFAVGLVPSASQVRDEPEIVTSQTFTGVDSFTRTAIKATTPNLNTILTEEGFDERMAAVVE